MRPMSEYRHAEAFCLMWYECKCGHAERLWNSRDGVTPFCLGCPSCGDLSLQHANFSGDVRAPDHKLIRGQRYFRDGTVEEQIQSIDRRIKAFEAAGQKVPTVTQNQLMDDARTTAGEWQKGWPAISTHNEGTYRLRSGGRCA